MDFSVLKRKLNRREEIGIEIKWRFQKIDQLRDILGPKAITYHQIIIKNYGNKKDDKMIDIISKIMKLELEIEELKIEYNIIKNETDEKLDKISTAEEEKIFRLRMDGCTIERIAEIMELGVATINRRLDKMGLVKKRN